MLFDYMIFMPPRLDLFKKKFAYSFVLGRKALTFTSLMNLQPSPQFTNIWSQMTNPSILQFAHTHDIILYLNTLPHKSCRLIVWDLISFNCFCFCHLITCHPRDFFAFEESNKKTKIHLAKINFDQTH